MRKTQFGFRTRCGTRKSISVNRLMCERRLEFDEEQFLIEIGSRHQTQNDYEYDYFFE